MSTYTQQEPTSRLKEPAARAPDKGSGRPGAQLVAFKGGDLPTLLLNGRLGGLGTSALNVVVASVIFFLAAPFLVLIAVIIKLFSPGPVFYTQTRVGRDRRDGSSRARGDERRVQDFGGRPFRMYKFRTMRVEAERETGPVWAAPRDRRVTRLGRWLRRYRIDELPQFWNVVCGAMGIVGPRPERPALVAYLSKEIDRYWLRHRIRPGITGWAQINQTYDTTIDSVRCKLMFDLDYIQRRSVLFDLYIMLRTLPALIKKRGW